MPAFTIGMPEKAPLRPMQSGAPSGRIASNCGNIHLVGLAEKAHVGSLQKVFVHGNSGIVALRDPLDRHLNGVGKTSRVQIPAELSGQVGRRSEAQNNSGIAATALRYTGSATSRAKKKSHAKSSSNWKPKL